MELDENDPFIDEFIGALRANVQAAGVSLDPEAETVLRDEVTRRLSAARQPDRLKALWGSNVGLYTGRVVTDVNRRLHPRMVMPEDVRRQFLGCQEVCPPPE
jgi:hypothetical protein